MPSPEKYPLPSYAANIWLAGDRIAVQFEGSHTIFIDLARCGVECNNSGSTLPTQRGWEVLLSILKDRSRATARPRIAERGAPVQYDIEQMLRAVQHYDSRGTAATQLEDLGSLEDLQF